MTMAAHHHIVTPSAANHPTKETTYITKATTTFKASASCEVSIDGNAALGQELFPLNCDEPRPCRDGVGLKRSHVILPKNITTYFCAVVRR